MAKPDGIFIYIGTYPSEAAARADYAAVKDLHAVGAVGTYDAAVVTKDNAGSLGHIFYRYLPAILLAHRRDNAFTESRLLVRQPHLVL